MSRLFDELMQGAKDLEAHFKGEKELTAYTLSRQERLEATGEEVKTIRGSLHLSQIELAKRLKMSVRTLQNWEQGRTIPNAHSLMLLRMAQKSPQLFEQIAST